MNYNMEITDARRKTRKKLKEEDWMGKLVEVYYNTHLNMLSVRDAKTKRVIGHEHQVYLREPTYIVQPAGRDKVRRNNRKNVHAWLRGTLAPIHEGYGYATFDDWLFDRGNNIVFPRIDVTYNPYKYDTFVTKALEIPTFESMDALVCASGSIRALLKPKTL